MSVNQQLPSVVPVLPLCPGLLLPRTKLLLHVEDPRYVALLDSAMRTDRVIAVMQSVHCSESSNDANTTLDDKDATLCEVGCLGRIVQYGEIEDNCTFVVVLGVCRFKLLEEVEVETPWRQIRVTVDPYVSDLLPSRSEDKVDRDQILATLRHYMVSRELQAELEGVEDTPTDWLVNSLCMVLPYGSVEKQAFLEARDLSERAELLVAVTECLLAKEGKIAGLFPLQ